MNKKEVEREIRHLKKMQSKSGNRHPLHEFFDYDLSKSEEEKIQYYGKMVLKFTREFADGAYYNCPDCGGILPEMSIKTENGTFLFTCTEIKDCEGKVLAKTDEEKLEKYLHYSNSIKKREKT
jgi:hypothetical protein